MDISSDLPFGIRVREVGELADRLAQLRDRLWGERKEVLKNPNVTSEKDARLTSIGKLTTVLESTLMGVIFLGQYTGHPDWWEVTFKGDTPPDVQEDMRLSFSNSIKFTLIQGAFSTIESSFRLFLKEIDPQACNGATGAFKNVYQCLFQSKLETAPQEGKELFDLLRLVRNTIHNNGVHVDRNGRSLQTVTWQGQTYEFRHGEPIDVVQWNDVVEYFDAAVDVLIHVINDPAVADIISTIDDPYQP